MASKDWTLVTGSLGVATIDRAATNGVTRAPGGRDFAIGFNAIANGAGIAAYFTNQTEFDPMALGGTVRGAMKRGLTSIRTGFAPFLFFGLQGSASTDLAYKLGLADEDPHRIVLRKEALSVGLPAKISLTSLNLEPYVLADLQTLLVDVDGGGAQTVTFNAAAFADITDASAEEVALEINADLVGATAKEVGGAVVITADDEPGSLEVTGGSAAAAFGFPSGVVEILAIGTATFSADTWIHLRLDAIERDDGDVDLLARQNDVSKNQLETPPEWVAVPGISDILESSASALKGGRAGFGFRSDRADGFDRFAYFDHIQIFRQLTT